MADTTYRIAADASAFIAEMEKARASLVSMHSVADLAKEALGALGIGLSIASVAEKINSVTEAMGKLKETSEKTGASVEALSRLQFFANVSGSNIDGVNSALSKLSQNMVSVGNEGAAASQALKYLQLSAKDENGNLKTADTLYGEIAQKLSGYTDGAGKNAIARALMGKAGAEQIPVMNKLVELGDIEASVTTAQSNAAEAYQIEVAKLNRNKEVLWNTVTGALLPSMKSFVDVLLEASKGTDSLGGKAKALASDGSITSWADKASLAMGATIDVVSAAVAQVSALYNGLKVTYDIVRMLSTVNLNPEVRAANYAELLKDAESSRAATAVALKGITTEYYDAVAAKIALRNQDDASANNSAENQKKALNWSPVDATKAAAQLKLYTSALQKYEEQLGRVNQMTVAEKAAYETKEGSLKTLTAEEKLHIIAIAAEVDKRNQLIQVIDAETSHQVAQFDLQEKLGLQRQATFTAQKDVIDQMTFDIGLIGQTIDQQTQANALRVIDIGLRQAQRQAAKDLADADGSALADELAKIAKQFATQKTLVSDLTDFKLAKERSWATGTASAFDEYLRNAGNAATQAKDLWTAGFKGMEDMLTNFFMKGKLGVKDFITVIEQALARLAAQTFVVNIAGAVGMSGIAGTAAASTAASGTAGVGSWLNAGSTINGAYNAMTGGLSATYASMANSTVGGYLGLSTQAAVGYAAPVYDAGGNLISAGTGGSAGGMTSLGSSVGTGLGYAGAGMAGIAAGSLIAGNKQVVGLDGTTISAIGAVIGSIWGPVGTFIGGVAGGVLDAAFGMGPKQGGTTTLAGQFSQSGFSGAYQTPWSQDGGWFRSDQSGVDTTALASTQVTAFQTMVAGTQSVFDKLTAASGEANTSLQGWTYSINEQVSTQAQQTQLISDVATSMGDYLIPSLKQFNVTGETLADTAVRLTDEFILTDKIASLMGQDAASAFGAVGMASAAARDSLVSLMGGVSNMTTVTQSYYTNFFSATEQHVIDLKALTDQFSQLGLVIPGTRDAFRTLVEQQDLSTTAGQQMYASLMSLNAAFAAVIPASTVAANAILSLADQITAVQTSAQTAVDAQIAASKSAATTAQNLAASYRQITVTLADEVAKIRGTSSTSGNLQSLYQTAMGGDATALASLPKAADDFLAASLATAKTSTEYAAAQAQVIGMLNNAGAASTGMASWYDNQTTLLQTQANLLDQIKTELAGPTPDTVLLKQQADLLTTIGGLLQDQTSQIVSGNGTQTLLMQDQTGKIILANGLTMDQTGIITLGNSFLADQKGLITASNQLLIDQTGKITIGNALVGTQTNQIITGNSTADAIKNLSSTGNTYSEQMLTSLVTGATTQTDSLASILSDNDQTVSLLTQLYNLTAQSVAQAQQKIEVDQAAARLQTAQNSLTTMASTQAGLISSVFTGIDNINALASSYGMTLGDGSGGPAMFGVQGGLFTSNYNEITGNPDLFQAFKDAFYAPGGVYDQTFGQSAALSAAESQIEAQRAIIVSLGGIPGHASGLDRVPYDGYLMRAHKDEAVLTAPEAANWRKGGTGAANDALIMEVRALRTETVGMRSELSALRQAANATAKNTRDTSNTLTRVTRDGVSLVTVAG